MRAPSAPNTLDPERGWPCQRLRLGFGLVLFFVFEVTIGRKLPNVLPLLALGLGVGSLVSALFAIRHWLLTMKLASIRMME
ncbi:hypothetical protein L6R52_04525 [Myxococcota bacterium]|nr:hypothetical protein [Myxococcota bacterium]